MLKVRSGALYETVRGQEWRWEIPHWSSRGDGAILDSELVTDGRTGAKFHFHLTLDTMEDNKETIGFYIHYKAKPVPKYTYALGSSRGRVLKQTTAHTIPTNTERCGHKRVVANEVVQRAIEKAGDDMLVVWFRFDHDTFASTGQLGEYRWTLPQFNLLRIGPFCSSSFARCNERDVCHVKMDVDRKDRSKVTLSVPRTAGDTSPIDIPVRYKFANAEGDVVFHTDACTKDSPARVPYATLLDLGRSKTLIVTVTFLQVFSDTHA